VIDTEVREDLLDRLRVFPRLLNDEIDGVEHERLMRAGPGGGWGAVEVLCHLRDWDEIYITRIQRTLNEDEPFLPGVDDSLWPIERAYHEQDPRKALDAFAERRAKLLELLDTLDPAAWLRRGEHFNAGLRTISWFAEDICAHDQEHLEQLHAVLAG
jgi:hypothetical protein